jgi:hypothetical protein
MAWLIRSFSFKTIIQQFKTNRLYQLFGLFLLCLIYGVILGLIHKNSLNNILADGQRYLYFGLLFIVTEVITTLEHIYRLLRIFIATLVTMGIKTLILFYIFTHNLWNEFEVRFFYKWVRDTRVGEVTWLDGGFVRVFFQSHVFELVGLFIIAIFIAFFIYKKNSSSSSLPMIIPNIAVTNQQNIIKYIFYYFSLCTLTSATIIISFSRSFWVGGAGASLVLIGAVIFIHKLKFKQLFLLGILLVSSLLLSFGLVNLVAKTTVKNRVSNQYEAALSSRWKLLPPLLVEAKKHPLIGSGFGTTVTYQSDDPRIKNESNPEGWNTTYAFEWGYLDFIVKIGIVGTVIYGIFIAYIVKMGWLVLLRNRFNEYGFLVTGLLVGFFSLIFTHMFSPYLNHPLGIGYLLMLIGIFQALRHQTKAI